MFKPSIPTMTRREIFNTAIATPVAALIPATNAALAVAITAGLAPAAAPKHPDAELIELDTLLTPACALRSDLAQKCDKTYEHYESPEIPESLCWRKSDFLSVWVDRQRLDTIAWDDGTERHTYASDGVLPSLKARLADWLAIDPIDRPAGDRSIARTEEIVAALEVYYEEEERQLAACGSTAASAAFDAQCNVVDGLLLRIAEIPARTAEGVCVKVRAALAAAHRDAGLMERNLYRSLLARTDRLPSDTEELLSISAMIDASKLDFCRSSDLPKRERQEVAHSVTYDMLQAYKTWLHYEHRMLAHEIADHPISVGFYGGEHQDRYRRVAPFISSVDIGDADRFHFKDGAPPPSTRAALVMSAVGCDWRE